MLDEICEGDSPHPATGGQLSHTTAMRVTYMDLSGMGLDTIDDLNLRAAFPFMVYLNASNNNLAAFPQSLIDIEVPKCFQPQLWALDLSGNAIDRIPPLADSMPVLGYLNLADNPIVLLNGLDSLVCGELLVPKGLDASMLGGCLSLNGVGCLLPSDEDKKRCLLRQRTLRRASEWKPRQQLFEALQLQPVGDLMTSEFRSASMLFLSAQYVALYRLSSQCTNGDRTSSADFTLKLSKQFWMEPPIRFVLWRRLNRLSDGAIHRALQTFTTAAVEMKYMDGDSLSALVACLLNKQLSQHDDSTRTEFSLLLEASKTSCPYYVWDLIARKLEQPDIEVTPLDVKLLSKFISLTSTHLNISPSLQQLLHRMNRSHQANKLDPPPKQLRSAMLTKATYNLRQSQQFTSIPVATPNGSISKVQTNVSESRTPTSFNAPPEVVIEASTRTFKGSSATCLALQRERVARSQEIARQGREERHMIDAVVTLSRAPPLRVLTPISRNRDWCPNSCPPVSNHTVPSAVSALRTRPCSATQLHRYLERRGLPHSSTPSIVERALRESDRLVEHQSPIAKHTTPVHTPLSAGSGWSASEEDRLWEGLEEAWDGHPLIPSPQLLYTLVSQAHPQHSHAKMFKDACALLAEVETSGDAGRDKLLQQIALIPPPQIAQPSPSPADPVSTSPVPWITPSYLTIKSTGSSQMAKYQKSLATGFEKSRMYKKRVGSANLVRRAESLQHQRTRNSTSPLMGSPDSILLSALEGGMHPFTATALEASRHRRDVRNHTSLLNKSAGVDCTDVRKDPMVCSASLQTMRRLHTRPVNGQFVPLEVRKQLNKQQNM